MPEPRAPRLCVLIDADNVPSGYAVAIFEEIASLGEASVRRIYGEGIAKGQLADGPVLFEADMSYQIDNMEGLDVWTREDGAQMVSLISDDNGSMFQRNLYLEFVLHDD